MIHIIDAEHIPTREMIELHRKNHTELAKTGIISF